MNLMDIELKIVEIKGEFLADKITKNEYLQKMAFWNCKHYLACRPDKNIKPLHFAFTN